MTIKQIALLKAKAGMSREAFIRRYEDGHAPLISEILPFFEEYRRSFLIPDGMPRPSHLDNADTDVEFDVVTELWFEDAASLKALGDRVARTDAGTRIADDESHLFDRSRMIMFGVEEHHTDSDRLAPRPPLQSGRPPIKMLAFLSMRPGMDRMSFITQYETVHAELAVKLLQRNGVPLFATYVRNYPQPENRFAVGEEGLDEIGFDVVTEMGFWTASDHHAFLELCSRKDIGAELAADEATLFDRDTVRVMLAEEYATSSRNVSE
jgi:hypothetical protein